jgi:predicted methyltransferase
MVASPLLSPFMTLCCHPPFVFCLPLLHLQESAAVYFTQQNLNQLELMLSVQSPLTAHLEASLVVPLKDPNYTVHALLTRSGRGGREHAAGYLTV